MDGWTLLFTNFVLRFSVYICISSFENHSLNMFVLLTVNKYNYYEDFMFLCDFRSVVFLQHVRETISVNSDM